MKPTVGRIVHYWPLSPTYAEEPCAAIITHVWPKLEDGDVTLHVFEPYNDDKKLDVVPYSADRTPGTWSWPERVS